MGQQTVNSDSRVTLFFALRLEDGAVVESNFEQQPATFVMGDGSMLPGYENVLLGMQVGQRKSFLIKAVDGFGEANPENEQSFPISKFADDIQLTPGLMVSFADAANNELTGVVKALEADRVIVDFNHPLAGLDITFEVEIVAVESVDRAAMAEASQWSVVRGLDNAD